MSMQGYYINYYYYFKDQYKYRANLRERMQVDCMLFAFSDG
jgi:hypothetical protein